MVSKIFLDIGDVYTKFALFKEYEKPHLTKRGFFVSSVVPYPSPHEFLEFEEQIYFDEEQKSKSYLVGWPAIMAGGQIVGESLEEKHLQLILYNVLFDHCDDKEEIEVYVSYDFGEKAELLRSISRTFNNRSTALSAKYIYEDIIRRKQISLKTFELESPLCLFEYFRSSLSDQMKQRCSMLIIDIGYLRSKICIIDSEKGLEYFDAADIGIKIYYEQMCSHFKQAEHRVNPFTLMQELELKFPFVSIGRERYDVKNIIKNIRWDLNKDLLRAASSMLKSHYEHSGHWVDVFAVTGGGSIFNGDLLWVSLSEEKYSFGEVIIDKKPRFSVLDGMPLLLKSGSGKRS